MTSDFYFTATSWFPGNVRVKPHSKHSAPPDFQTFRRSGNDVSTAAKLLFLSLSWLSFCSEAICFEFRSEFLKNSWGIPLQNCNRKSWKNTKYVIEGAYLLNFCRWHWNFGQKSRWLQLYRALSHNYNNAAIFRYLSWIKLEDILLICESNADI